MLYLCVIIHKKHKTMLGKSFLGMLQKVVEKVQERNRVDPNVKTADTSVFESVKKSLETATEKDNLEEICDEVCVEVDNVQVVNQADPNIETADSSVFEEMKKELEALKAQVANQNANAEPKFESPIATPAASAVPSASENVDVMAMTNSGGGSLAIRMEPNMGAPTMDVRLPDSSVVRVVEYSNNKINLDGREARFVLVNGTRGWILETYLNFN